MKCYYELLEIARDADDSEIKTAYRKLALRWHPDKNIGNTEEAKEQFQLVQQAYEVLSDRQERAWYDNHREQILRGSNKDFKDDSLDVFPYFTTSCFRGYGDDENGFYAVYSKIFSKISTEDIEHMDSKSDYDEIPLFGNSKSDYDNVVGPFYAYWSSYNTKKSYVWLDPYNISEARGNGRVLKMIEKENKKIRLKAKKERNEEIRSLVAFVRKRDKRVQANAKRMEAKIAENRLKQEQLRKQKILENKKELNNSKSAEWSKFDNVQSELKQIEKNLAAQFGEILSETDDSVSEDEVNDNNDLYCVACNKLFKTPKAFANHESSKKHRENVEVLKQTMLDEENEESESFENISLGTESSEVDEDELNDLYCVVCDKEFKTPKALANHELSKKHLEKIDVLKQAINSETVEEQEEANEKEGTNDNSDLENIEEELSDLDSSKITNGTKKKNKKAKKVIRIQKLSMTEDSEQSESEQKIKFKPEELISDDDFDFGSAKKSKKKNKTKIDNSNKFEKVENDEENLDKSTILDDDFGSAKKIKKKNKGKNDNKLENDENVNKTENSVEKNIDKEIQDKKKIKKSQKKNIAVIINKADLEDIDITHCCVTCKSNFPSKNKLFDHLKKTGHSIAIPEKTTKSRKKVK